MWRGGEAAVCGSQWGSSPAGDQRSTAVAEAASVIIASIRPKTAPLLPPPAPVSWQGDHTSSPSIPYTPLRMFIAPLPTSKVSDAYPLFLSSSQTRGKRGIWCQLREIQTWSKSTGALIVILVKTPAAGQCRQLVTAGWCSAALPHCTTQADHHHDNNNSVANVHIITQAQKKGKFPEKSRNKVDIKCTFHMNLECLPIH